MTLLESVSTYFRSFIIFQNPPVCKSFLITEVNLGKAYYINVIDFVISHIFPKYAEHGRNVLTGHNEINANVCYNFK